jgi:FHA domain
MSQIPSDHSETKQSPNLLSKMVAFLKSQLSDATLPENVAEGSGGSLSGIKVVAGRNFDQIIDLIVKQTVLFAHNLPARLDDSLQVQISRISAEFPKTIRADVNALLIVPTESLRKAIKEKIREADPGHIINLDSLEPIVLTFVDELSPESVEGDYTRIWVENDPMQESGLENTVSLSFNNKIGYFVDGKTRDQLSAEYVAHKKSNLPSKPVSSAAKASKQANYTLHLRVGSESAPETSYTKFPLSLGKDPSADIKISNEFVSGFHLHFLALEDGRLQVKDNSTNGTWFNGEATKLKFGEVKLLGGSGKVSLLASPGSHDGLVLFYRQTSDADLASGHGVASGADTAAAGRSITRLLPSGAAAQAKTQTSIIPPSKPADASKATVEGAPDARAIVSVVMRKGSVSNLKQIQQLPQQLDHNGVKLTIIQRETPDSFIAQILPQGAVTVTKNGRAVGPVFVWQAKPNDVLEFSDGYIATLELGAAA